MRTLCIISLLALTGACASSGGDARALRCDSRLWSINAPGPSAGASVQKAPASIVGKGCVRKP
jgi:hypothetical protein